MWYEHLLNRRLGAVALSAVIAVSVWAAAPNIALQHLDFFGARPGGQPGVQIRAVLKGEIKEVTVDLVSIVGPRQHLEQAKGDRAVVWLFVEGKGIIQAGSARFLVEGETIARAPQGWDWKIDVAAGEVLHAVRIRRHINDDDRAELKKFPQNNTAPYVKKFSECPPYGEAIKSAKTTSRTLLPENYVPRMAVGTVETTGPDKVGAHRHPMLEQLFLGLKDNDITVLADDARANLTALSILHIPIGSNHGAEVADGKKLHYVWMDFFMDKKGQEWLKMHTPLDSQKKQ